MTEGNKKARRGFSAMSPEKQKEIASMGGKAAHAQGTAHVWTPEQAKEAGRRGGMSNAKKQASAKGLPEPVAAGDPPASRLPPCAS